MSRSRRGSHQILAELVAREIKKKPRTPSISSGSEIESRSQSRSCSARKYKRPPLNTGPVKAASIQMPDAFTTPVGSAFKLQEEVEVAYQPSLPEQFKPNEHASVSTRAETMAPNPSPLPIQQAFDSLATITPPAPNEPEEQSDLVSRRLRELLHAKSSPEREAPTHHSTPGPSTSDSNYYVAVHPFTGQRSKDLSFAKGEKVRLIDKKENGWWLAEASGRVGFVPSNFLEPMKD